MRNRSQIYSIIRPRPRHGHKYTKYKIYLSIIMVICITQHLSNIWSRIHKNLSNTEAELKKSVGYKKSVYIPEPINNSALCWEKSFKTNTTNIEVMVESLFTN